MSHAISLAEVEQIAPADNPTTDDSSDDIRHADGSIHYSDGSIDHPDGTVEFDGYHHQINWDELDPPDDDPRGEEIPHEVVKAEICSLLGLSPGSL